MTTRQSEVRPARTGRVRCALAALALTAGLGACGPDIHVQTAAAPDAHMLAGRRTFSVVEASKGTDGDGYGVRDPMVDNSITSYTVAEQIKKSFEARGYRYAPEHADFQISYRATVAPIQDVETYGYGGYSYYGTYGFYDSYWRHPYNGYCCADDFYGHSVASYDRGTVIVDAIDPVTNTLLWRGQGTSDFYSDSRSFMSQLRHAVKAIAKKFPAAGTTPFVAVR